MKQSPNRRSFTPELEAKTIAQMTRESDLPETRLCGWPRSTNAPT